MKSNFIVLLWLLKRRFRKAQARRQLRTWYNNREVLADEIHSSGFLLVLGFILLLCIAVGGWPFVMFIKYGEFLFGY